MAEEDSKSKNGSRRKWLSRRGSGPRRFFYVLPDGSKVTDEPTLERIRGLVIPPAWRDVLISPFPNAKLQATGVDAAGRRQYKYHARFTEAQARQKFKRMEIFGRQLKRLRAQARKDARLEGFPLEKVLAIMTQLVSALHFRVGTERSVKEHRTYGITTLKKRHLSIQRNGRFVFDFVGKSKIRHRKKHVDPQLAKLLGELARVDHRSGKLFLYASEDGEYRPVRPAQLNRYIKLHTSAECSAKDFRTWGASMLAALEFAKVGVASEPADIRKNIVTVVKKVAKELGNTPAVCRNSYIHPSVILAYERGKMPLQSPPDVTRSSSRVGYAEAWLIDLIHSS